LQTETVETQYDAVRWEEFFLLNSSNEAGPYRIDDSWLLSEPDNVRQDDSDPEDLREALMDYLHDARNNCVRSGVPIIDPIGPCFGMEVGDDRVTVSRSTVDLALVHVVQEKVMMMKTSQEDTFISSKWYNLAEVTTLIPRSQVGSFNHARKSGQEFADLEFIDDQALRVILNVQKGEKTAHPSTVLGKAMFLRTRMKSRPEVQAKMQIGNLFQDSLLQTAKAPDPKYIPVQMGGIGHPPLFDMKENVYLYVKSYKNGTCERILGSACAEAQSCLESLEFSGNPEELKLCSMLRLKQEYLHATYEHKIALPAHVKDLHMPEPLYKALGPGTGASAVEARLVRAKAILPRKNAETEFERSRRYNLVIFGLTPKVSLEKVDKIEAFARRKCYDGALSALTAFQNLIQRKAVPEDIDELVKDGWSVVYTGQREFTMVHAKFISDGCKGTVWNLSDISHSQDIYLRSEISCEECLKIGGITLTSRLPSGNVQMVTTTSKIGLYEIGKSQVEWASNLALTLENLRITKNTQPLDRSTVLALYYNNREWVADDTLIVGRATKDAQDHNWPETSAIALVTTDRKLCNKVAHSANVCVERLHPVAYLQICKTYGIDHNKTEDSVHLRYFPFTRTKQGEKRAVVAYYVDTGSVAAHLSKLEEVRASVYKRSTNFVGRRNGLRTELITLTRTKFRPEYTEFYYPNLNKNRVPKLSESSSYRKAHSESSIFGTDDSTL